MANKIKVFVGFLALTALFSVFAFFDSFRNSSPISKTTNILKSSLSLGIETDTDHDGLTNKEESYWNTDFQNPDTDGDGFLDGEEVASGHDPLIPGPDDFLPTENNLTEKLSALTLAGLYEGSLKSDNTNFEASLNELALVIMDDAENSFNTNTSDVKLRIVSSDKKSQQAYVEEFSKTHEELLKTFLNQMLELESNLNKIGNQGFANKDVTENFKDKSIKYKKSLNEFLNMSVPKAWQESHLGVIKFTGSLVKSNESIAMFGKEDPVKASLALNKMIELWDVLPGITKSYADKIKEAGLSTEKTIFK